VAGVQCLWRGKKNVPLSEDQKGLLSYLMQSLYHAVYLPSPNTLQGWFRPRDEPPLPSSLQNPTESFHSLASYSIYGSTVLCWTLVAVILAQKHRKPKIFIKMSCCLLDYDTMWCGRWVSHCVLTYRTVTSIFTAVCISNLKITGPTGFRFIKYSAKSFRNFWDLRIKIQERETRLSLFVQKILFS
jgi:hypothetical protein